MLVVSSWFCSEEAESLIADASYVTRPWTLDIRLSTLDHLHVGRMSDGSPAGNCSQSSVEVRCRLVQGGVAWELLTSRAW